MKGSLLTDDPIHAKALAWGSTRAIPSFVFARTRFGQSVCLVERYAV
jgi:hypothetical protein